MGEGREVAAAATERLGPAVLALGEGEWGVGEDGTPGRWRRWGCGESTRDAVEEKGDESTSVVEASGEGAVFFNYPWFLFFIPRNSTSKKKTNYIF